MVVLEGRKLTKTYREGRHEVPGAPWRFAVGQARRGGGDRGALGIREDHPAVHPGLPLDPDERTHRH